MEEYTDQNIGKAQQGNSLSFKSKCIKDLKYTDLEPYRYGIGENKLAIDSGFYFEREGIDDKLLEQLNMDTEIITLIGNPLAGKTAALIHNLKKFDQQRTVLIPGKIENINNFETQNLQKGHILILENVNWMYENLKTSIFDDLLKYCINNGTKILATCMRGPEYDNLINGNSKYKLHFDATSNPKNIVEFKKLEDKKQLKNLINQIKSNIQGIQLNDTDKFDRNIGSLFLPIKKMEERYQDLKKDKKSYAYRLLQTLKFMYLLYHHDNFHFNEILVQRTFEKIYAIEKEKIKHGRWNKAIEYLEDSRKTLNFIVHDYDNRKIITEEAYLKSIFKYENYKNAKIERDRVRNYFNAVFTEEEKKSYDYQAPLTKMYSVLLNKAQNFEQSKYYYQEMLNLKIQPNEVTFNSLIHKAQNFEESKKWYKEMIKQEIKPNIYTFSSLLKHAFNLAEIEEVETLRQKAKVQKDDFYRKQLVRKKRQIRG